MIISNSTNELYLLKHYPIYIELCQQTFFFSVGRHNGLFDQPPLKGSDTKPHESVDLRIFTVITPSV